MQVTYVTYVPAGMGGAEKLLLALIGGGSSRRHRQTVLNLGGGHSSEFAAACSGVDYREFKYSGPLSLPEARQWLRAEISRASPDVIHASLFLPLIVLASLRRHGRAARLLTHVYGDGLTELSHPVLRRLLDAWACGRFDCIVAISDSVSRLLIEEYGCRPDRV